MRVINPYTPGAGYMPTVLAGRDKLLEEATYCLENLQNGFPQRPIIYYGLRGVGKTVLLNAIENAADNRGVVHEHIEAGEDNLFTPRLIAVLTRLTTQLSSVEAASVFVKKCLALLRAFKMTYSPDDNSFSMSLGTEPMEVSGIYSDDLTDIFVQLGKAASKTGDVVCLFVDEMQYLSKDEIAALIMAMHRCNQLRLPVSLFCAGLPKLVKLVGEARTYAERLFYFEEVDALDEESARVAVSGPADTLGVRYETNAENEILRITGRYPYFIQELCSVVWSQTDGESITDDDVKSSEKMFFERLDRGFFMARYDRCSNGEKTFMTAMVKCGELPCTIKNVASILGRTVKSISPVRGKLINKGLIYATGHAEIDFTVPQFDSFIRRKNPTLEL